MKKQFTILLLSVIFICLFSSASAQYCGNSGPLICTPVQLTAPGLSPTADSLAPVIDHTDASLVINFKNYNQVLIAINQATVDSLRFDTISNLPNGLCWATNSARNTFGNSADGCIVISGLTDAPPGQYKLRIIVTAYIQGIGPYQLNADAEGLYYYLRVNCSEASQIVPVDTTGEAGGTAPAFTPYLGVGTIGITSTGASICSGNSVTLAADANFASYTWSNNNTLPGFVVSQAGTYNVTATSPDGCSCTGSITINQGTPPAAQTIVGNPDISPYQVLTYSVASTAGISYAWGATGGVIQSGNTANSAQIEWGATGPYQVTLVQTNTGGCSDTVYLAVNATDISNIDGNNLWGLHPNPAISKLFITLSEPADLTIDNLLGEQVLETKLQTSGAIDISALSPGVYFIYNRQHTATAKFIKE